MTILDRSLSSGFEEYEIPFRGCFGTPSWIEFSAFALSSGETDILDEEIEIIGPHAPPHLFARKARIVS